VQGDEVRERNKKLNQVTTDNTINLYEIGMQKRNHQQSEKNPKEKKKSTQKRFSHPVS